MYVCVCVHRADSYWHIGEEELKEEQHNKNYFLRKNNSNKYVCYK